MINFRIIARVFSLVLVIEGLFMLLSASVSIIYGEHSSLIISGIITIVTGILVFTPLRDNEKLYGNKEGYIIVTGIWLVMSLFGTIPYLMSGTIRSFGDAFFESMSGFTTTGASILTNVESLPHGILFWRSLTQWLGGLGFIIISLSVLQVVKSINIPLTLTDFTGQATNRIHPKIKEAAKRIITIYVMLTLSESILLMFGGMNLFDALCHSFTTISTGGFSTRNDGIASFSSPWIMIILTVFMFLAGTNLTLVYFGLKRNFRKILENNEFIFYTITCIGFILVSSFVLVSKHEYSSGKAFLEGAFQSISIITTTGFYHTNYSLWGSFLILVIFLMMLTGGMSGSASGSLKVIRLLLITKNTRHEMRKLIHPNGFIPVRHDRKIVTHSLVSNLLVFITLYFLILCFSSLVIALMGNDIVTSFGTSASLLGNIGPGLGNFGPFTNYSAVPMIGKWFFSFLMLIGRVELFSVLVLFTGGFYRK
ncbi:MAG: TrkH family potassium uptake protein [Bacteroidales bacterium]